MASDQSQTTHPDCPECGFGLMASNDGSVMCAYCEPWGFRDAVSDGAIYTAVSKRAAGNMSANNDDQSNTTEAGVFRWTEVRTIDEMEAFFLSRLPVIRDAAKRCGFAIGLHGSLRRDLDLIAVPWVAEHTDADTLARAVHRAACGLESASYQWSEKPAGRIATSFPICWTADSMGYDTPSLGCIDLSVAPSKRNAHAE